MKILCLSQDKLITEQVTLEAKSQKWLALIVSDREDVDSAMKDMDPDMLIVDVANEADLEWWRTRGHSDRKPVLFMNEVLTEDFVVKAFECGADGLIPKPLFSRRFLTARVNAYLKRQGLLNRQIVPRLNLVLDSQRYKVEVRGRPVLLTLTEFKILRELATDEERVVNRQFIQTEVFGAIELSKRSLDVHICSLRKKLRPLGLDIDAIRGVGYRLVPCLS